MWHHMSDYGRRVAEYRRQQWERLHNWSRGQILGEWIVDRLNERNTWVGMFTIGATLFGMHIDPAKAEAIATVGTVGACMAHILMKGGPQ